MPNLAIKYDAPDTLSSFMDSNAFVRVIVGPIGSGKSSGCIMEILARAAGQARGPDGIRRTRFCVIRNTYRQLNDTTKKTFQQWIPEALGKWNKQDFSFHMKFGDIDCEVLFRALDSPEDVKKVLSLELTGAYFNELREIPKLIFDGVQGRCGRYPSVIEGGVTWDGVWGDTNPWPTSHWGYKLFSETGAEGFELFEQPGGREPNAENVENLRPGYYARLCAGKDAEWIAEYVDAKYPSSDRGSVYGHLIQELKDRGGMNAFEHPADGVFACVDLGISDAFAIWWFRFGANRGVDIIDHYEAHGRPLSHFFDVLDNRGFKYTKLWLPHDARARSLQTGVSVQDQFMARYPGMVAIGPELFVADGIQASRWLLEQPTTRFHPRCSAITGPEDIDGIEALRAYKYEYDEEKKVYKKTPLHDWSSHSADAFRYLALVVKHSGLMVHKPEPVPEGPYAKPLRQAYKMPDVASIQPRKRERL